MSHYEDTVIDLTISNRLKSCSMQAPASSQSTQDRKRRRSLSSQQQLPISKKGSPKRVEKQLPIVIHDESPDDFMDEESEFPSMIEKDLPPSTSSTKRNDSLKDNENNIDDITFESSKLRVGKTVEIEDGFLFITSIIRNDSTGKIRLRGHSLERCRDLNGMLEKKLNELCWVMEVDEDDDRPDVEQSLREIALEDVLRIRATLFTNEKFSIHAWKRGLHHLRKEDANTEGWLIVRYKMTTWWPTGRARREAKLSTFPDRAIEVLTQKDLESLNVSFTPGVDIAKRVEWRGETMLGGASRDDSPGNPSSRYRIRQKYTYFDAFCGAGGATRGAADANLQVQFGFDRDEWAAISWRLNFEQDSTIFYEMSAFDMITDLSIPSMICDILHLSPPCQFFSPAHTVAGLNDEENFAALYACGLLLDRVKPRIGTLEQTVGLSQQKFRQEFNSLVLDFTKRGYSIRWKLCSLPKWGLPQRRTRLIMIFAGPGETLPNFPPYTHADPTLGPLCGLKPFVTMNKAFSTIPLNHPLHNVTTVKQHNPPKPHYPDNQIAPRCITTSGGQNYHPTGTRNLTFAEFAVAQGFPLHHRFSERCITKQIGNAYAPNVAGLIFKHIRKCLREADGLEPEEEEGEKEIEVRGTEDFEELIVVKDDVVEQPRKDSLVFMGVAKRSQTRKKSRPLSIVDLSLDDDDAIREIVEILE